MNLSNFTENDAEAIIEKVFAQGDKFSSIESAYQQLTQILYEESVSNSDEPGLVLSRVYHSFDYFLLPQSLQKKVKEVWKEKIKKNSKILTLMGTYGKEMAWRDRTQSKEHQVILLAHETMDKIPMVSRLLQQIGFDLGVLLREPEAGVGFGGISGTFGVFYVSPALGSSYIPAQDFVESYDIQSVIGTGAMLPQGDISVYIGFSRVPIENKIAANFAPLMSFFWQRAYSLLEERGMFTST